MAIERIVAQTPAGPMLSGLDWRPPATGNHSKRNLREAQSQTEATHYCLLEEGGLTRYGLYKPRPAEELVKVPKNAVAAAACFAALVGKQAPNAALVLPVEGGDERDEQKYVVVVLEDGLPYIDRVGNEIEARDTIGSEERPTWAFSEHKYPNCQVVGFEWLATGATKATKVLPIPPVRWPAVALALAVLLAVGGWWGFQKVRKAEEERIAAQQAAEEDPVPRYLAALTVQAQSMATRRSDVAGAVAGLFDQQVIIPGWQLISIDCTSVSQQCALEWKRQGGTYQDIKASLPSQKQVPVLVQGTDVPDLDRAMTVTSWTVHRQSLLSASTGLPQLPSLDRAMVDFAPILQVWRTAGLAVDLKATGVWPVVEGVPPDFRHPSAVRRGEIQVNSIPGPFIQEVIESAPPWVQWESLHVQLSDGDVRNRLNFKLSGVYYVASN